MFLSVKWKLAVHFNPVFTGGAALCRPLLALSAQCRESLLHLSSSETLLKREVQEARDALEKVSALNSSLATDKRDLNMQLLKVKLSAAWLRGSREASRSFITSLRSCLFQLETELSDSQSQLQTLRSEVSVLQRDIKSLRSECSLLR